MEAGLFLPFFSLSSSAQFTSNQILFFVVIINASPYGMPKMADTHTYYEGIYRGTFTTQHRQVRQYMWVPITLHGCSHNMSLY